MAPSCQVTQLKVRPGRWSPARVMLLLILPRCRKITTASARSVFSMRASRATYSCSRCGSKRDVLLSNSNSTNSGGRLPSRQTTFSGTSSSSVRCRRRRRVVSWRMGVMIRSSSSVILSCGRKNARAACGKSRTRSLKFWSWLMRRRRGGGAGLLFMMKARIRAVVPTWAFHQSARGQGSARATRRPSGLGQMDKPRPCIHASAFIG